MIENQSDNIDNKENDISDQDNVPEDSKLSTIGRIAVKDLETSWIFKSS